MSSGVAKLVPMEVYSDWQEMTFSSKFSCIHCGHSLNELEPRLFSFNNPVGACEACSGLGVKDVFDEEKVVANPELSLEDGAVYGWSKQNAYFFQMLMLVGVYYGFRVDQPFCELTKEHQKIILYGSGNQAIDFSKIKGRKGWTNKSKPFEGIIPRMMRRYEESEIRTVREELSRYVVSKPCISCNGDRLSKTARNVFINNKNISDLTKLSIEQVFVFFDTLQLEGKRGEIASKILKEIVQRLKFLINVGLDYLSLERRANTLSGGEAQRIRLASQIGAGLIGVLYVLDEPSIGLHQRDNQKLLDTLTYLKKLGNTVIVVEHDEEAIRQADYVIDIGPGAGIHGGEIIAFGAPEKVISNTKSLTGDYLSGRKSIGVPDNRKRTAKWLRVYGATGNNLKNVDLEIPLGVLTCITGVSGSGKSTLINNTLYQLAAKILNSSQVTVASYKGVDGLQYLDKVVNIDQSPIGRTPRSNSATYTGVFTLIRELFAQTLESRSRGYKSGRFSFNVVGGRCEACKGDGLIKVEMHFLPDIYVSCDVCSGHRYNRETLEISYKGKAISEVLDMTVEDALDFFQAIPKITQKIQTLIDVGLSYITLGQNATTLSGGEAQRIKLSKELSKTDTGQTLYILDEPTTGLHFHDIKQFLSVVSRLRDRNNTIVIIEHNLDVIKTADWVIDLGPGGGDKGGEIVAYGTPEMLTESKASYTGQYLKNIFSSTH
jgi:excinuclease ABC subunit A